MPRRGVKGIVGSSPAFPINMKVNTLIIGGVPRCGKSWFRRKLLEKYHISGITTDWLRDGLETGVPEFGIRQGQSDREKAKILWPYFRGILINRQYYNDLLLVEGVNFLPKYLAEFKDTPYIRTCFVGYPVIDAVEKFKQIKKHDSVDDDWHKALNDDQLLKMIQIWIKDSLYFKNECEKYGINFFDLSKDFKTGWQKVEDFLVRDTNLKKVKDKFVVKS